MVKQRPSEISIEALPMYDLLHGPKPGEVYHPKGRGNGYILTLGGKRLYFMGDTECTPEARSTKNIDVAFVPVHMPYTMTPGRGRRMRQGFSAESRLPVSL
jgi:L-ascorbate metabolism protein UlaG (beta-lactamase superfamily)